MPLVLALEPDARQAAVLKRVIHDHVHADLTIVDTRDGALTAINERIPDVILLTALLSPRDEEELFSRLRSLAGAEHVQTHTIPQLAGDASLEADERGGKGMFGKLRRKKPDPVPITGCEPELFAEEVVTYLQRATELKARALRPRRPPRVAEARSPEPFAGREDAPQGEDLPPPPPASSWASPFEWRPSQESRANAFAAPPAPAGTEPAGFGSDARDDESEAARLEKRQEAERETQRLREEAEAERQRLLAETERQRAEVETQRRQLEAEAERRKAEADAVAAKEREAERVRVEAARAAERVRVEAEREKERLRVEAERQAERLRVEAQRHKEDAEREKQRLRAEAERQKLEAEAVAARRREAERLRQEAEKEKERLRKLAEQEKERLRVEAERVRQEAEREAERLRLQAEQQKRAAEREKERLRLEAERQKLEAERRRMEAETAAARQREAERLRKEAEREAERLRLEAERQKLDAQREAERMRQEAERQRKEAEAAAARQREAERLRLEAMKEAEHARLEAERQKVEAERERLDARREAERLRAQAEEDAERAGAEAAIAAALKDADESQRQQVETLRRQSDRERRHRRAVDDAFAEFRDDPIEQPQGTVRLVPLSVWARLEEPPAPAAPPTVQDELKELMKGLAIPPHVAGVTYARGCRIRRVRVPAGPPPHGRHSKSPVILSRRALEEVRSGGESA